HARMVGVDLLLPVLVVALLALRYGAPSDRRRRDRRARDVLCCRSRSRHGASGASGEMCEIDESEGGEREARCHRVELAPGKEDRRAIDVRTRSKSLTQG